MPFMVMYRRSDGSSGYEQADAIDEAALFVERLRNKDGIEDDIRIFRMEEISFAFRPYYKVELGMPDKHVTGTPAAEVVPSSSAAAGPAPATATEPDDRAAMTVDVDAPADAAGPDADGDVGANGRRGLFGR